MISQGQTSAAITAVDYCKTELSVSPAHILPLLLHFDTVSRTPIILAPGSQTLQPLVMRENKHIFLISYPPLSLDLRFLPRSLN